jgi:hypothetical protein
MNYHSFNLSENIFVPPSFSKNDLQWVYSSWLIVCISQRTLGALTLLSGLHYSWWNLFYIYYHTLICVLFLFFLKTFLIFSFKYYNYAICKYDSYILLTGDSKLCWIFTLMAEIFHIWKGHFWILPELWGCPYLENYPYSRELSLFLKQSFWAHSEW